MISWRFDRVDRTPWRVRTMWPLSVADNGGKCLEINSNVSPGNVFSWSSPVLFRSALSIVDFGGDLNIDGNTLLVLPGCSLE